MGSVGGAQEQGQEQGESAESAESGASDGLALPDHVSAEILCRFVRQSVDPMFLCGAEGRLLVASESFEHLVKVRTGALRTRKLIEVRSGAEMTMPDPVMEGLDGRTKWTSRAVYTDLEGVEHDVEEVWTMIRLHDGTAYAVCHVVPYGAASGLAAVMRVPALDALTRLPARTVFLDRLNQALLHGQRHGGCIGVLFVDLDRFKEINDAYGHPVGDQILCQAADRLRACLRDSDTVARIGGDEFAILLPDPQSNAEALRVAERIRESLHRPVDLPDGRRLYGSCSIGIASWPDHGSDPSTLIDHADMALYAAKDGGRNKVVVFDPQMRVGLEARVGLEQDLRRAVADQAFTLLYQPVFQGGIRITSVEALVRMNTTDGRMLEPAAFLDVAESIGLGPEIGAIVLRQACRQAAEWRAKGAGDLKLSVNVSRRQMEADGFLQAVRDALRDSDLPSEALIIDVHESVVMRESVAVEAALRGLTDLGVNVAVDDFGSGFSSLKRLADLPLKTIKISRGLMEEFVDASNSPRLIGLLAHIARELGLSVIAEGVETQAQAERLNALACNDHQGFLYGRPAPPADIARALFGEDVTDAIETESGTDKGQHATAPAIGGRLSNLLGLRDAPRRVFR